MAIATLLIAQVAIAEAGTEVSQAMLNATRTSDSVETSIGTLEFLDGAPHCGDLRQGV